MYLNTLQDWIQRPQHPVGLVQYKLYLFQRPWAMECTHLNLCNVYLCFKYLRWRVHGMSSGSWGFCNNWVVWNSKTKIHSGSTCTTKNQNTPNIQQNVIIKKNWVFNLFHNLRLIRWDQMYLPGGQPNYRIKTGI